MEKSTKRLDSWTGSLAWATSPTGRYTIEISTEVPEKVQSEMKLNEKTETWTVQDTSSRFGRYPAVARRGVVPC